MKKIPTRAAALALSALLAASPAALASQALGTEIHISRTHLAQGVDYTCQHLWSATYSDMRVERYLEYSPNPVVQPAVSYGSSVLNRQSLTSLAQGLESEGKRVLGGVNGDYFVLATGAPLGMVVTDGILRSSSSDVYALGFYEDGRAFIGWPNLQISASFHGYTFDVGDGLNKVRTDGHGYVLYSSDFAATTTHAKPGVDVILTPVTGDTSGTAPEQAAPEQAAPEQATPGGPVGAAARVETAATLARQGEDIPAPPEEEVLPAPEEADPAESPAETPAETEETPTETPAQAEEPPAGTPGETQASPAPDAAAQSTSPYANLKVGGHITCVVEQVLHSDKSIDIPEGKLILSINEANNAWHIAELAALQPGETVEIDITSTDSRWENAVTVIGGLYKLVSGGQAVSGLEAAAAPRTAVGVRADGSAVFYTIDGRQSGYSVGASLQQVAQRLVELGCVEALALDGGGSTTFGATLPGEGSFTLLSQPSEGTQRLVTNALFLAAEQAPVGQAASLVLSPGEAMLLPGGRLTLCAVSADAIGQTVASYGPTELSFAPTEGGTIEEGVLTAGTRTGTFAVSAGADGVTGSALYTVVDTADTLTLRDAAGGQVSSIHLEPGESVDLTAAATYKGFALTSSDESFTWSVSGGLGTIDSQGVFTAGETGGTGSITVSGGGMTVTVPLTVAGHIATLEDFEGDFSGMADGETARLEPEGDEPYVRYGRQSGKMTYTIGEEGFAAVPVPWTLPAGERYFSLWVYGDGSGNTLAVTVDLADGGGADLTLTALDHTGWKQVMAVLPEGALRVSALKALPTGGVPAGVLYLDQATASNQAVFDAEAPAVTVSLSGTQIQASFQDNIDRRWSEGQIRVTWDGQALPFTLSGNTAAAALPALDGGAHRVTVAVTDASGNLGRASADVAASQGGQAPFADTAGHWAGAYIDYLYSQGVSNGSTVEGALCFLPDKDITRGEFALMCARWLRLDLAAYSEVALPFDDAGSIPAWCLEGVKAMFALGVMQGSAVEGGGVYAFADQGITRAEAMTMLGRMLPRGYAGSELTFSDAGSVPAWAADHVGVLAALGVVNGYEDHTIAPNAPIQRGEMAKILYTLR